MKLYIQQKVFSIGDSYSIYDDTQQEIFRVQGEWLSIGAKIHLYDMHGEELFFIAGKVLSFLPQYSIYRGDRLCAQVKKEFSLFSPRLTITSNYGDFEINGDFWDHNYSISREGRELGVIRKEWMTWGDCYEMLVYDPSNAPFFSALVIAVDQCQHNEN